MSRAADLRRQLYADRDAAILAAQEPDPAPAKKTAKAKKATGAAK